LLLDERYVLSEVAGHVITVIIIITITIIILISCFMSLYNLP